MDFEMLKGMWPVLAILTCGAAVLWWLEVRERRAQRNREAMRRLWEARGTHWPPPQRPAPPRPAMPPPLQRETLYTTRTGRMSSGRSNLRDTAPVDSARTSDPMPLFADDWVVPPVSVAPSECTPEPDNRFTGCSGGDAGGGGASDSWDASGPSDAGGGND